MPAFLRRDDGIFDDDFIDERRKGLEQFINKYVDRSINQLKMLQIDLFLFL